MKNTVLITGAASGIGRSAAELFSQRGWSCILVDRDTAALDATLSRLPGQHISAPVDLSEPDQISSLANIPGQIDAVVNNAGIADPSGRTLVEQDPEDQALMRAVNLEAPGILVAALMRKLAPGARIVNVSSNAGLRCIPFRGYYSITKAGLIGQTQAFARAHPEYTVSVLCPGFTRTELNERLVQSGRLDPSRALAKIPLGRWAEPRELAEAIYFLAGSESRGMHGQTLQLDGGSGAYGGSSACAAATVPLIDFDNPVKFTVIGNSSEKWSALSQHTGASGDATYPAIVDVHALSGGTVSTLHKAAIGFAREYGSSASLTFLLPDESVASVADANWQAAGEFEAMRMMIRALACELAPRALRVNAIETNHETSIERLRSLVHYIGGARAQFLTGQVLRCFSA